MPTWLKFLGIILAALVGLVGFVMTNSPEDVVSNVSKWWVWAGGHAPYWLINPEIDTVIRASSVIVMFIGAVGVLVLGYKQRVELLPAIGAKLSSGMYSGRRSIAKLWTKVEPWHIIAIGLAVAVGGIVWQQLRSPPIDPAAATLRSSLDATKQELENLKRASKQNVAMQTAPPPVPLTAAPLVVGSQANAAIVAELERIRQEARTAEDGRRAAIQSIKSDKERLDAALYEMFDTITKEAIPAQTEIGNLVANWHMKLTSADGRSAFLAEIDRIRPQYIRFLNQVSRIMYQDYNYYMSDIQTVMAGGTMDLHGFLDKLKVVVQALPEASTLTLPTVRLIEPQVNDVAKAVQAHGVWANATRDRIRQKRHDLAQARQ